MEGSESREIKLRDTQDDIAENVQAQRPNISIFIFPCFENWRNFSRSFRDK